MRKHDLMQCMEEETMWFPTSCWDIDAQQRRLIPSRRYTMQESSGVLAAYKSEHLRKIDPDLYWHLADLQGFTVGQAAQYVPKCENLYQYMRSTCRMSLRYLQSSQDFYMDNFEHLDMDDVSATKQDMVEMDLWRLPFDNVYMETTAYVPIFENEVIVVFLTIALEQYKKDHEGLAHMTEEGAAMISEIYIRADGRWIRINEYIKHLVNIPPMPSDRDSLKRYRILDDLRNPKFPPVAVAADKPTMMSVATRLNLKNPQPPQVTLPDSTHVYGDSNRSFDTGSNPVTFEFTRRLMQIMDTFIVLMNTRNVEMRTVKPSCKMNRTRRKKGKILLKPYAVVDIPYAYSDGQSVRSAAVEPGRQRQSPRMHLRRGHIRTQHYGKGMEQTKRIWIKPVLVNSTADAEIRHDYHVHTS